MNEGLTDMHSWTRFKIGPSFCPLADNKRLVLGRRPRLMFDANATMPQCSNATVPRCHNGAGWWGYSVRHREPSGAPPDSCRSTCLGVGCDYVTIYSYRARRCRLSALGSASKRTTPYEWAELAAQWAAVGLIHCDWLEKMKSHEWQPLDGSKRSKRISSSRLLVGQTTA